MRCPKQLLSMEEIFCLLFLAKHPTSILVIIFVFVFLIIFSNRYFFLSVDIYNDVSKVMFLSFSLRHLPYKRDAGVVVASLQFTEDAIDFTSHVRFITQYFEVVALYFYCYVRLQQA